jgi:anti-sigma factor RsiW
VNSNSIEMEKEFQRFLVSAQFDCMDVENLVDFYVDGDLPSELQPKFQTHLMKCSSCKELVDDVVAIVDVARTLSNKSLPEGVKDRLREHLKQEVDLKPPPKLYLVK